MNTFLRYLVYCFIVLYIIGWIHLALPHTLEYILGSQGMHEGVVVTTMDIFNSHQGQGRRHGTTLFTTCTKPEGCVKK